MIEGLQREGVACREPLRTLAIPVLAHAWVRRRRQPDKRHAAASVETIIVFVALILLSISSSE